MIKNSKGEKQTPKQKAADILAGDLCIVIDYWYEKGWNADDMTEKEHVAVQKQLNKFASRILKMTEKTRRKNGDT